MRPTLVVQARTGPRAEARPTCCLPHRGRRRPFLASMGRAAGAAIHNPKEHDMLVSLADFCYRRRRLVVVLWLAALMGSFALAGAFGGEYKQEYLQPGSESKAAADTLADRFPQQAGDTVQIVVHADTGVSTGEARSRAERIFADVAENEHVVGVVSPYSDEGAAQISADGTTAYADVAVDRTVNEFTPRTAKHRAKP